jgi:MoaA/NifB/PqqE/SkfB family radical SAM enzyme
MAPWLSLARWLAPRLAWLQIEVTSHCNAGCRYCPHTLYRQDWQARHLPWPVFQSLVPVFRRTDLVYLQGWGEPLLHPDFFSMVALARQAGCRVGTTTNATLLTEEVIHRLVASGLDILAFSLTGLGARHDYWRAGTSFQHVMAALRGVAQEKRRQGRETPQVHVAYLLLRSGLGDLADLPQALSGLGISQVVVSTLDLVASPELRPEAWKLASPAELQELSQQLAAVVQAGAQRGLTIHPPVLALGPPPVCPENILRAAVISAQGDVAPCVYRNLPSQRGYSYQHHLPQPLPTVHFGNIQEQPFWTIWQQQAYRAFRRAWSQGQPPAACRSCLRIKG